jgi:hypothetical protein
VLDLDVVNSVVDEAEVHDVFYSAIIVDHIELRYHAVYIPLLPRLDNSLYVILPSPHDAHQIVVPFRYFLEYSIRGDIGNRCRSLRRKLLNVDIRRPCLRVRRNITRCAPVLIHVLRLFLNVTIWLPFEIYSLQIRRPDLERLARYGQPN